MLCLFDANRVYAMKNVRNVPEVPEMKLPTNTHAREREKRQDTND